MTKPTPPDWISDRAKEIFAETLALMGANAIPSDTSCLADFCEAQADVERLTTVVNIEGDVVYTDKGTPFINPTLTILMGRRKDVERGRHDLGLTPKARSAITKTASANSLKDAMKRT